MPITGGSSTGYGAAAAPQAYGDGSAEGGSNVNPGQRGYRRMRFAAMAGNLYRSGQQAVTDIKEQYAQTKAGMDPGHDSTRPHIPGAFPDVAITVQGDEQMILFPCYAKRHVKKDWSQFQAPEVQQQGQGSIRDEEYWRQEWERNEDERAIVDVDVRGWIYNPQVGPMTRRNRMLLGLARQLSGLTAPRTDTQNTDDQADHGQTEIHGEQERIEREAAHIERRGQHEKHAAYRGEYSEAPQKGTDPESGNIPAYKERRGSGMSASLPPSPTQTATQYSTAPAEMTEAELVLANANLMARVAPFMTNPLVAVPITVFFYNDTKSQSRTVHTNDAGHFIMRAALDFVPTHVRVLANEDLSAIQDIKITEPYGISLISDVDDTIKKSNISAGAREIFRNTFVKDLSDLTVEGVKEWYNEMHRLDVSMHYCSNSPWQLFPVLASFFKLVGLPPGSLHLKQYSGMLQGIFEPVAERKKSTLDRLMRDFPNRKFLLVGDSGEADLEVYTDLALANPGKILAIFIRDVTTPEMTDFFDSSFMPAQQKFATTAQNGEQAFPGASSKNTSSATAAQSQKLAQSGPLMGDLIDFSEEPQSLNATAKQPKSAVELLAARKPPPPRPLKPAALRSTSSLADTKQAAAEQDSNDSPPAPPLPTRKSAVGAQHPLAQMRNVSSDHSLGGSPQPNKAPTRPPQQHRNGQQQHPPQPPPPRRRATPSSFISRSPKFGSMRRSNSDIEFEPLGPAVAPAPTLTGTRSATRSPTVSPSGSPLLGPQSALNRKLELWRRRVARAQEQLDHLGVALYTWRRGQDVIKEAVGIVEQAQKEIERSHKETRPLQREMRRAN
jgi:ATP-dependent RNA helicase DDX27